MNIILVTDAYPPEIRSSSHLMYEMAHELNSLNHNITVLTSWPRYNLNKSMQKSSFKELTFEDGILVIRVKTLPHHKVSFITRGISQLIMPWQFLACLKKHSTEIRYGWCGNECGKRVKLFDKKKKLSKYLTKKL